MPPITVGPGEGVSMALGPPVIFNNAHLKHGHQCPHVPASRKGTWQGHGGTGAKAPLPPGEGAGAWEGAEVQPGARICPLPGSGHPTATAFGHHSVNLKFFGKNWLRLGQSPTCRIQRGWTQRHVWESWKSPGGDGWLSPSGVSRSAGDGDTHQGRRSGTPARACSVPVLPVCHFPARWCWLGTGAPAPRTNPDHPRCGETEAQLEQDPIPASFPLWGAGRLRAAVLGRCQVLPLVSVWFCRAGGLGGCPWAGTVWGPLSHPHHVPQGAQHRAFSCIRLQHPRAASSRDSRVQSGSGTGTRIRSLSHP